jgi:hypothetical protein
VLADFGYHLPEAACGEDAQLFGCPRIGHRQHAKRHQQ